MRNVLFLLLLGCASGCASQPRGPTEAQLAMRAYYTQRCIAQGIDPNDQRAMIACWLITSRKDEAAMSSGQGAWSEFGQALQAPPPRVGTTCTSRPDGLGGIRTYCD
jgi:hypothetical protein